MKVKSAVLASALVAVSSVFADGSSLYDSDVIYTNWFNRVVSPKAEIDGLVLLNGETIASVQDGYAVTADVSVVIHASLPSAPTNITVATVSIPPKGSICAAYDNNGDAKWYGLQKAGNTYDWVELNGLEPPTEGSHTLVTEFDDKGEEVHNVRYWVDGNSSGWLTSGHKNALTKVGLDGSGSYTKVVGLLVNAWSTTIDSVPISINKAMLATMGINTANTTPAEIVKALKAEQVNGIAAWANYVLGIDGTNEDNKPFAAPVQNSKSDKLTFKLGGVKPVAGTGATVTYGVAVVDSPSETGEPTKYVDVGDSIELNVPTTVKYYRIKTKIDQTQTNN